jgi:nucleotide-binding universal stress UspA family protein
VVGARLAARWNGTLTGCYLDPALRLLNAAEAEPTVLALLYESSQSQDDPARADFAGFAARYGVQAARWAVVRTGVAQTLRMLGAWHDLAVLERDLVAPEGLFEVLGEALLGCRTPCLVLPEGEPEAAFARIAVGWNGRIEAIRAIRAALPLLAGAGEVCVLDGAPEPDEDVSGLPRFDPCAYLAAHGIAARRRRFHAEPSSAGAALLREVRGYDLLVMGAYGHSRMRERVLGGATRHVLEHARVPVLMMH